MDQTFKKNIALGTVKILNKVLINKANSASSTWYYEKKQPHQIACFKKSS